MDEYLGDGNAIEHTEGANAQTAQAIRSICHDVLPAHHERNYQAFGVFLFPAIWKYLATEVTVLEIQNDSDVFPHVRPACPTANESMIFPVARNGHMVWGKPTSSTSAASWSDWLIKVNNEPVITRSAVNWAHRLEVMEGTCHDLSPR